MRRILMMCIITAIAALPLMAAAQERPSEGYLIPKDAEPARPSLEAVPAQPSFQAVPDQNVVREAQIALRDAGFDPGGIDGVMGPKTRQALREFQASQGLPQTGKLDATTHRQLLAEHMPQPGGGR
jgi:peptidoglycan hydrolase-like protein with peptidoglycan-binding domain